MSLDRRNVICIPKIIRIKREVRVDQIDIILNFKEYNERVFADEYPIQGQQKFVCTTELCRASYNPSCLGMDRVQFCFTLTRTM